VFISDPSHAGSIKGVMARGKTSVWIAPPGGMKSALMVQASICVSSGTDWHGRKDKGAARGMGRLVGGWSDGGEAALN
jgi:hypothetical protein